MKRKGCLLMVVFMALMVAAGGCAEFQKIKDLICNPTAEQKADAAKMLAALDAVQMAGAVLYPPLAMVKASAVLTTIQNGGCFLVAELEEIFKILDEAESAKMRAMKLKAPARFETYPALRKVLRK